MNLLDRYYARHLAMAVVKIITALSLLVIVIDLLVARGDNISKYQIPWGSVAPTTWSSADPSPPPPIPWPPWRR